MSRVFRLLLVMLVLLIIPVTTSAQGVNPETEPAAQIRFVHGITNIQAVDIYLDGELIVNGLPFGNATDYGFTNIGTRLISVLASTTDGSVGQSLLDKPLELSTGLSYTLAVSGNEIQVEPHLFEDKTGINNESQGSLRVVNLAQPSGLAAAINDAAFTGIINYGASSDRKLVDKSNVSPAVSILDQTGNLLLSTEPIFLGNGEFYTLFVLNSGTGLQYTSVNYPLTSGQLPTSSVWVPVVSFNEQPAGELADEQPAEQPAAEQPAEEQPAAEQPAEEQPAAEQPAAEQPAAEQPAEEQPAAEQPAAEQPAAEQPAAEQPAAEQPAAEQPAAEQPEQAESHEGQHESESEHSSEGESSSEGEHSSEGESSSEGEHSSEGESSSEGEHSTEGETLEALLPVPLWMLIGCSLLVVLLLLGGSWLWWVAFHRK